LTEYNLEYLNSLIENKVEENLNLDYKASGSLDKQNNKTTEISKDVSAMANSDGGILIYGINEVKVNKHLPEKIDPINRKDFTKEWLEQIIQDKICPRISNFKIHPIEINAEQVVYVVDVEKSNTAHQAFDKKYYKRFNFQSTAMYDYEIRDILNRSKNPIIELEFELKNQQKDLVIYAVNRGSIYAKYVNAKIWLPKNIVENKHYKEFDRLTLEIYIENTIRDVLDVEITTYGASEKLGPSRYEPILPSQILKLTEIRLENYPFDYENILQWEIFCDNALPKRGEFRLQELLNRKPKL
jgi:predicted HTH transcriptional regulator